jgi:F-type H+-transporting ATPase subunit b
MSEENHSSDEASHESEAAGTAQDTLHAGAELHTEVGHADTGFTCAPGLPQMCTDTYASQIFWLVLTFVFLYVMMSRVTLPKIGRVIEERRDRIADDLGKAEDLRLQSETAIADYEQALADARAKAHVVAQETRDRLSAEADERGAEVEAELNKKLKEAEAQIAATKAKAMTSIREVATDTAAAVVTQILGEDASEDAIGSAVDTALQRRGE